jgi:hypothetical protein
MNLAQPTSGQSPQNTPELCSGGIDGLRRARMGQSPNWCPTRVSSAQESLNWSLIQIGGSLVVLKPRWGSSLPMPVHDGLERGAGVDGEGFWFRWWLAMAARYWVGSKLELDTRRCPGAVGKRRSSAPPNTAPACAAARGMAAKGHTTVFVTAQSINRPVGPNQAYMHVCWCRVFGESL